MKTPKIKIFDRNHVSNKLTEEQVAELKSYYHTYHRKCWAYKQDAKWKSLSVIFASGLGRCCRCAS